MTTNNYYICVTLKAEIVHQPSMTKCENFIAVDTFMYLVIDVCLSVCFRAGLKERSSLTYSALTEQGQEAWTKCLE